jgi:HEAT repeat protein
VNAIWGMSQLARKDKKYAEQLLPLLTDKDAEIRAQAAKWLGDIKYAAAGSKLIPLLKDEREPCPAFLPQKHWAG